MASAIAALSLPGMLLVAVAVPWQASLAAFAVVQLLTVLPVTPGGLGIVEPGLIAPLADGLGSGPAGVTEVTDTRGIRPWA